MKVEKAMGTAGSGSEAAECGDCASAFASDCAAPTVTASCGQPSIGDGFRAALLANANLGGDCCNRGMLLGSLLGCIVGESNIPADLITGLYRYDELRSSIDALADAICKHMEQSTQTKACSGADGDARRVTTRLGHSWPLPLAGYTSKSVIRAPVDFRSKTQLIHQQASEAGLPVHCLRFIRGLSWNPIAVVPDRIECKWEWATMMIKGHKQIAELDSHHAIIAVALRSSHPDRAVMTTTNALEAGDAAADRAEVLAAMSGAQASAAAPQAPAAVQHASTARRTGGGDIPQLKPSQVKHLYDLLEDAVNQDSEQQQDDNTDATVDCAVAHAHPSDATVSNDAKSMRPTLDVAPGTGIHFYPHPADLDSRLGLVAQQRAVILQRMLLDLSVADPVETQILQEYGVCLRVRRPWIQQQVPLETAPSEAHAANVSSGPILQLDSGSACDGGSTTAAVFQPAVAEKPLNVVSDLDAAGPRTPASAVEGAVCPPQLPTSP